MGVDRRPLGGGEGDQLETCSSSSCASPPVERLRRWRQAALVLNASRRFRYTLDLKKEEEKEQIKRKIRAHAQVIRAAPMFKEGEKVEEATGDRSSTDYRCGISAGDRAEELAPVATGFGFGGPPASGYYHHGDDDERSKGNWKLTKDEPLLEIGPSSTAKGISTASCTICGTVMEACKGVTSINHAQVLVEDCHWDSTIDHQVPMKAYCSTTINHAKACGWGATIDSHVLMKANQGATKDHAQVLGRSSPVDKLLLVEALRKGHVVAVTGDGTDDAPALHEADIGLAMGIQGPEVEKEISDIITLDDNFTSVKVARWCQSVYTNIQKFIQFQLTVNVAALIINVVAALTSGDVPLNAVQLLWVNLIMDTIGALALATEPPTGHLMERPPVHHREPFIINIMWRNLLIQVVQALHQVILLIKFGGRMILHLENYTRAHVEKVKNTFIFDTSVLRQICNELNAHKPAEMNVPGGVTKIILSRQRVGFIHRNAVLVLKS